MPLSALEGRIGHRFASRLLLDEALRHVHGVATTRVGYVGGQIQKLKSEAEDFRQAGRAEVVEVENDPSQTTVERLLAVGWKHPDFAGAFQFYALKKELVDSSKMSLKAFNDAILRENNMPVEMVMAILTNQPLKRDFTTSWRFYDVAH